MWWYVITISLAYCFFLTVYGHLENTTFYISYLCMKVAMQFSYGTRLKLCFYKHNGVIITVHLAFYSIPKVFPLDAVVKLKVLALYHNCSICMLEIILSVKSVWS